MSDLTRFTIANVIRKLREINPLINDRHRKPFPKEQARRLSHYQFRKEFVHVNDDGSVRGGISQLVASVIDFSFVSSITADAYSFILENASEELALVYANNLRFFRVEEQLTKLGLVLRFPQSNVNAISL